MPRIKRRVVSKASARKAAEGHGGQLGDEGGPLVNGLPANPKRLSRRARGAVEGKNVRLEHVDELNHTLNQLTTAVSTAAPTIPASLDDTEDDVNLGDLIRTARLKKGFKTASALARAVNVTPQSISKIENGKTKTLSLELARALNRVLGIPLELLAGQRLQLGHTSGYSRTSPTYGSFGPVTDRVRVLGSVRVSAVGDWLEIKPPEHPGDALNWPSDDPEAYALQIFGDVFHPRVKSGEFLVVEPSLTLRPGRDVLVRLIDGRMLLRELAHADEQQVALNGITPTQPRMTFLRDEVLKVESVAGIVSDLKLHRE